MCKKCDSCYDGKIYGCSDAIKLNGHLLPETNYIVLITDHFGNRYTKEVTTDAEGLLEIDAEGLPAGFFTNTNKPFTVNVFKDQQMCEPATFIIPMRYECIKVTPLAGPVVIDTIGCDCSQTNNSDVWES